MPALCLVCQISNLPLMWESDFRVRVCLHWVVCPSAGIVQYFEGSKKSFTYVKVGLPGSGLSPLGGWSPSWQSSKLLPIPRLKKFCLRGSWTSRFLCAFTIGIKPISHVRFSVESGQHIPLPPESFCEIHIFNSSLFFRLRIYLAFPYRFVALPQEEEGLKGCVRDCIYRNVLVELSQVYIYLASDHARHLQGLQCTVGGILQQITDHLAELN